MKNLLADETKHEFLACGQNTYLVDETGKKIWEYPHSTRDGYVLPDQRYLLAISKSKIHPGGAVVIVGQDGNETRVWEGTQSEVNSAQPTPAGTIVLTEAGPKPRLIEIDQTGKVVSQFSLVCQIPNHHMQTRMARKLDDETFLVPHLLDFAVKQYDSQGTVLRQFDTTVSGDTQHEIHTWPFTAIRHGAGQTLVCCTHGNRILDFNEQGKVVWQLTNADLPGEWIQDACGGQVLPNGNIVFTSYAGGNRDVDAPKLIEISRDKKVVWTYRDGQKVGIHHFQILTTNGVRFTNMAQK